MSADPETYDVIVCGAGHAGIEAALAAARMGTRVLLLTGNLDTIGQMSCNPAIGGVAKGNIVREIDALGGEMGVNADSTGIQFRLLNASRGSAVQSPRVQCDKKAYQLRIKHALELQAGLRVFQAQVTSLILKGQRVVGCRTGLGIDFFGRSVVITTGTFLRGLMHVGTARTEGGRMGDFAAKDLSSDLARAGIQLERLKTGTPPRLLGRTLDFSRMHEQVGDSNPTFFGFYDTRVQTELFHVEQHKRSRVGWRPGADQLPCWITHTTKASAEIVHQNLLQSAMYSGAISGTGPRYCPSIEDKVVRFASHDRHLLFLEPEGRNSDEYYVNGLSTSLPYAIQMQLVRSIPGLEAAEILRPAYAVEYDFAPPTQLLPSLESKLVENLFFAGQINGTSGYEEAAGQGLVAGVNATLKTRGEPPLVLGRHEGYIGVLIDDLITKGTREPYRMFTSRAEHRLLLNHGSAELRLFEHARRLNLIPESRMQRIEAKSERIGYWSTFFAAPSDGEAWADLFRRRTPDGLPAAFLQESRAVQDEVAYRIVYDGYLKREIRQIQRLAHVEHAALPRDLPYLSVAGLKRESAQKLAAIQPATLGQARRISGVNPSDISILMIYLAARNRLERGEK